MTLNDDGTLLVPAQRLTGEQLSEHIASLMRLREGMSPRIPDNFGSGTDKIQINRPNVVLSKSPSGDTALSFRNGGFGWMSIILSAQHCAALGAGLTAAGSPYDIAGADQAGPTSH